MFTVNPMPPPIAPDLIAQLEKCSTGAFGHVRETGFMDPGLQLRLPGARVAGTAVTVRVTLPDSVIAHHALGKIRPGDILLIDRGGDTRIACWGSATTTYGARIGLKALIIDGACHDIACAVEEGLPIWCRTVSPVTTKYRQLGGEMNVPISCGGVTVRPGDAVLADENGIMVLGPDELAASLDPAVDFESRRHQLLERIRTDPTFHFPEFSGANRIVQEALNR